MKIKDTLQRDPATNPLLNQGQARIPDTVDERVLQELKWELSTFVCEGQFAEGLQKILSSFLTNLNQTSQKAAWVSGFFGSGKSHFAKMLCHLWQDTEFADGSTARSLVPSMPEELRILLRELDTVGKRTGGRVAAAGSILSGTDHVRLTVLGILLRAVGLPTQYSQAQFCLWLKDQNYFEGLKSKVAASGKNWEAELNDLYVSGVIAKAILDIDKKFAANEIEAKKAIREQFPQRNTDISTEEFLSVFKRALKLSGRDNRMPCTVLILDEVQQYIGGSNERSSLMTEVVEAVSKQLDGQVMIVGTGQSALTDQPLLQKMMDRFTIRVPLYDTDVETVTRKVLLQKKPTAIAAVQQELDRQAGEISRQLQGTRIAERKEDEGIIVDDYPLLPVHRRFWENSFRQVDAAGTQSQLRSQLRIIHDAVAKISDKPLGNIVSADELYDALAPEMVNTGVLPREINERIINLSKDGSTDGKLARRICGVLFLINKLPREATADIGVRATKEHVSDLLIDDLGADNGKLRSKVESLLKKLASSGVLMMVGDEYRLQTKEGTEWDREFRNRQTKLANDDTAISMRRDALLYAEADRLVRSVKIIQGSSKEARQLWIHRDQNPPQVSGDSIPVWIRDGWSCSEKEHVEAARKAGSDSPVISVFIPRQSAEDLRRLIIEAEAAEQTLNSKGVPTTAEGLEARRSTESRRDLAVGQRDEVIQLVVANSKAFQGGGNELLPLKPEDKLREAANASLARLFLRFNEADSAAWGAVIKRARDGADQPFQPLGYAGATEQHPVCQQVLLTIGSGKSGGEIRKTLQNSPFGWPRDAVDAALIALHRLQSITSILNGTPVPIGQLDQNKIQKSEFRVEKAPISVSDRLAIRKLYMLLNISCKSGEEALKAADFLAEVASLGKAAGGTPPLPVPLSLSEFDDLQTLAGNEQLLAIKSKATLLETKINECRRLKELAEQRLPIWKIIEQLTKYAAGLSEASEILTQVEAVRNSRLLLDATDRIAPLRAALADVLRQVINDTHSVHEKAYSYGLSQLDPNRTWLRVPEPERASILSEVGLVAPVKGDISNDEALISTLEKRPLVARAAEADAVAGRVQRALELAAKYLEPKIQIISLERSTLRTEEEVRQWLEQQEKILLRAIKNGPILVN